MRRRRRSSARRAGAAGRGPRRRHVVSRATEIYFINALVAVAIVVALYVFVGNSGVLSFGHISFVAVGALAAGVLSVPARVKPAICRTSSRSSATTRRQRALARCSPPPRRRLRAPRRDPADAPLRARGRHRDVRACSRSRTTSCATGRRSGPGLTRSRSVPETTGLLQATIGAMIVIVAPSRTSAAASAGCCARRARIAAAARRRRSPSTASGSGRSRSRERSPGFAGGLYVHLLPINDRRRSTWTSRSSRSRCSSSAATSLWGAVVGALAVSGLDSFLAEAENGRRVLGIDVDLPAGTRLVVVGALMALVLILRPSGLTGGRELSLAWLRRRLRRRR